MLLAWNASSSIVKQNDCKNKTIWLTQTALSKSFSLFHTTYTEDIKWILKDCFFHSKLILNDLATKSLNVELKIVDEPKIG